MSFLRCVLYVYLSLPFGKRLRYGCGETACDPFSALLCVEFVIRYQEGAFHRSMIAMLDQVVDVARNLSTSVLLRDGRNRIRTFGQLHHHVHVIAIGCELSDYLEYALTLRRGEVLLREMFECLGRAPSGIVPHCGGKHRNLCQIVIHLEYVKVGF